MAKYRIKSTFYSCGEEQHRIQVKFLGIFWRDYTEFGVMGDIIFDFSTLVVAEKKIVELQEPNSVKVKSTYKYY